MSKKDKMGWDEKSFYITVAIGLALGAWSTFDFNSLQAVVTSRTAAILAPYIVGGALLLMIGILAVPLIGRIIEENRNVKLRARLLDSGQKASATIVKIEKTNLDVNDSPLVMVTFETKDHIKGSFKTFASKMDYTTKAGDNIDIIYNPMNPKEVIPAGRLQ